MRRHTRIGSGAREARPLAARRADMPTHQSESPPSRSLAGTAGSLEEAGGRCADRSTNQPSRGPVVDARARHGRAAKGAAGRYRKEWIRTPTPSVKHQYTRRLDTRSPCTPV
ncbi:hypothetical protein GCM10009566_39400 [Streptomyces murinus]